MANDLFISYAHQGDKISREAVAAPVARWHVELEADFHQRFNRDLEIFFDMEDIKDFDHWQVRCHRALRDSRFFIACLSRVIGECGARGRSGEFLSEKRSTWRNAAAHRTK